MKKLLSLLLAVAMMMSLASCGDKKPVDEEVSGSLVTEESSDISSEDLSSEEESSKESSSEVESSKEESKSESSESSSATQKPPIPRPESSESNSVSKPSVNASNVYDAMDKAVASRHNGIDAAITNMPMQIDDSVLSDMFGVSLDNVASYKGFFAGTMTNCDIMLVVEAKEGKKFEVKKALEAKLEAQKKQFEHYAVMGNLERLDAAKVVDKGNFVALLIVGAIGENEENYDCAGDVSAANSAFNSTVK